MMYIRIRPSRFFIVESFLVLLIVAFLSYRYFNLVKDPAYPISPLPLTSIPMLQYPNAAVVSTGEPCAKIGTDVLRSGGNAVDAAIATMLCDSVVCPDLTGFGGGFLMTVYNRTTKSSIFVNAREMAPGDAKTTMFVNDPLKSLTGALAVAVPGMLRGIWVVYNLYGGGVPWTSLVTPTIQLCEKGIVVSKRLGENIQASKELILNTGLKEYFVNNQTGDLMQQGDIYTMLKLGQTLRIIANEGADALYAGPLTSQFTEEIRNADGIITDKDLSDYLVQIEESFEVKLKNGYQMYSGLPPSSGIVLAYILRLLDGNLPAPNNGLDAVRLVEAFKFAYGERSHLGDHMFVDASEILEKVMSDEFMDSVRNKMSDRNTSSDPRYYNDNVGWTVDHGTANVVAMDSNGNAVVGTSTLNTVFGSGLVSHSTGIILNNQMNDFSTPNVTNFYGFPPSPTNFIQPYKRPMSSMCPTVITDDKGDVVLAIGGSGGPKITLSTAYVTALVLWYNKTLKEAVEEPRLYHQLIPMRVDYEYGVLKPVIDELRQVGHQVKVMMDKNQSAVAAIHKTSEGFLTVVEDFRQPGNVSGY